MLEHRPWADLDGAELGWLKAKHHFAVDISGNPAHRPLGSLVVWNDDEIAPKSGFPLHGHRNIEIITYVRQGVVAHEDDLGSRGRLEAGDVQVMSAGTGIRHTEYNPGDVPLKIFQIWIVPRELGGMPRWATKPFPKADRSGKLVALASGLPGDDDALPIRADGRVLGATLRAGESVSYALGDFRNAYMALAFGLVTVNGERVGPRDGVAITKESSLQIVAVEDTELVLVDVG